MYARGASTACSVSCHVPRAMQKALSFADLEEIRADCFADDIDLPDIAIASTWTEAQAREYFESGGITKELATLDVSDGMRLHASRFLSRARPRFAPSPPQVRLLRGGYGRHESWQAA